MTGHKTVDAATDFPLFVEEEGIEVSTSIFEASDAGAPQVLFFHIITLPPPQKGVKHGSATKPVGSRRNTKSKSFSLTAHATARKGLLTNVWRNKSI
jgi:hypothetical protein